MIDIKSNTFSEEGTKGEEREGRSSTCSITLESSYSRLPID